MCSQSAGEMSSRMRFRETMRYRDPDRVPYFEEGIRQNVLNAWRTQGLTKDADISRMFPSDRWERIELDPNSLPRLPGAHTFRPFLRPAYFPEKVQTSPKFFRISHLRLID